MCCTELTRQSYHYINKLVGPQSIVMLLSQERLVSTALNLFHAEGFRAVGMNRICTEAKVNKGTLYHFFPSKVDLVLAALDVYADSVTKTFKRIVMSDIPAKQKLEEVLTTPFEENKDFKEKLGFVKGCFVGNLALEIAGQNPQVRDRLTSVFREWAEEILPVVIDLGIPDDTDPLTTARSIIAYLQGIILLAKVDNDPHQIKSLASLAFSLIPQGKV